MKITLLYSNPSHPIAPYLQRWAARVASDHTIELINTIRSASGGDILFLISCSEKVEKKDREKYRKTLVLHASDLPLGRGWSPHVWDIIEGADQITLSLLEAEDVIDSGSIWKKVKIDIPKHALCDEINHALFVAEIELIDFAVNEIDNVLPTPQSTKSATSYRRKRIPADSKIDPIESISAQFDLIRVCDPDRFPAFFDLHGCRYRISLEKIDD